MVSIDTRIRREARRQLEAEEAAEAQLELIRAQGVQKLREFIRDDLVNMLGRFTESNLGTREDVPSWLHMKSFDDTYMDLGPEGKSIRTRLRIQVSLDLVRGNREVYLREYRQELDNYFPIPRYFTWEPVLRDGQTKSGRPLVTIHYHWRRAR